MYEKNIRQSAMNRLIIPKNVGEFYDQAVLFKQSIMKYESVIKKLRAKLEVLNDEMALLNKRNPIELIKYRVKDPSSIVEKLQRRNFPVTVDSMEKNLNDVAGIRLICSFIDDIYDVAEILSEQDDIKILEIKDYIKNPKANGYRSYHMIVETPVFFSHSKQSGRAEIQRRTMAMDFWASLEHQLKYKKDIENPQEIAAHLAECAQIITNTDLRMQEILYKIMA